MKFKLKGLKRLNPNKERLPGYISEVAETLGSVYALPKGLL
jgi:hypothetical protein